MHCAPGRRRCPRPTRTWPADGKLRIGLQWACSEWDRSRSLPLALLAPLFRVSQAHFFSLQQGPAADDARHADFPITLLSRHTREIAAAAAAMLALDLVITVDNMVAHLAGTLGRPTWLLLKHEADWRWMDGRNDSPWYPSLRLLRQPQPGDWAGLASQVADTLREHVAMAVPGKQS